MKFVGIDALPQEGVAYVSQGILNATFQYPTGGADAIEMALKICTGKKCRTKSCWAPVSSIVTMSIKAGRH